MLPSDLRLILYTHRLPTTFMEGWDGTKVQVLFARKAWISSRITLCHTSYLLASLKTSGSWEGGETTWLKETSEAAVVAVDSAVLGCLGWRTMRCWRAARHGEVWPVPGRCWRGYEERSTQSCRPVGEAVEGLVCTADTCEAAAEQGWSAAELGCSVAADLRTCASGDGEPVPA